jgi:hypothetical protein
MAAIARRNPPSNPLIGTMNAGAPGLRASRSSVPQKLHHSVTSPALLIGRLPPTGNFDEYCLCTLGTAGAGRPREPLRGWCCREATVTTPMTLSPWNGLAHAARRGPGCTRRPRKRPEVRVFPQHLFVNLIRELRDRRDVLTDRPLQHRGHRQL